MLREYKLYEPIKILFESKGYSVYSEIPILSRRVDIGALKNNIIIVIEMKMSLTKKVIWQAHLCKKDKTDTGYEKNPDDKNFLK